MESAGLCFSLVDQIRAHFDPKDLCHFFENLYGKSNDLDRMYFNQLFLYEAAEHNHAELISYLLIDDRFKSSICFTRRSLLDHMRTGSAKFVSIFIEAHSSASSDAYPCDNLGCLTQKSVWYDLISAITNDWFLDQLEILKLLVSFDVQQNLKRDRVYSSFGASEKFKKQMRYETPLEIVMNQMGECFNQVPAFQLSAVVQMLIDAGVNVNSRDAEGSTPLIILLSEATEIFDLLPDDHDDNAAISGSRMIVDTVKILIAGGANLKDEPSDSGPLNTLLSFSHLLSCLKFSFARNQEHKFQLIRKLVKLLLCHGVDVTVITKQIRWVFCIASHLSEYIYIAMHQCSEMNEEEYSNGTKSFNAVMECFGHIYRYLILAGANSSINIFKDEWINNADMIINRFICLAEYSSDANRSSLMIRLFLRTLSFLARNKLLDRLMLLKQKKSSTAGCFNDLETSIKYSKALDKALEWMNCANVPLKLQDMASNVIICALPHGQRLDTSTLLQNLPVQLQKRIFLKD